MIRLTAAAVLALCIHAGMYWIDMPWPHPTLITPQSRAVSIDLVAFQHPVEKAVPPKPKEIKPEKKPKPVTKPVVKSLISSPAEPPHPAPPEPLPETVEAAPARESYPETQAVTNEPAAIAAEENPADEIDDRATVRASVPRYDLNPPPRYPHVARRRNYQGTVVLEVRVTVEGRVAQVRISQSSGYSVLDKSAVKSVKGWHFTPARRGGIPFEMWVQVPVRYELQ